jgi:hypothetical protein
VSREIALSNIRLEPTERWGRTEYSLHYHPPFLSEVSGLAISDPDLQTAGFDAVGLDFI